MDLNKLLSCLRRLLDDNTLIMSESLQSLWSGYGQIIRLFSERYQCCYVVKVVAPPQVVDHPRGWHSDVGHERKLKSYQVESAFYQQVSPILNEQCKVPKLLALHHFDEHMLLVLEDLDELGFDVRIEHQQGKALDLALRWLAQFHAQSWRIQSQDLWPTGSYWHLSTRQSEWQNMPESELKQKAKAIDQRLASARFKTLIHGDAKFANFCFHHQQSDVAAVDFQYVGYGSPVKDIAYLASGCLSGDQLFDMGQEVLMRYLSYLAAAFEQYQIPLDFTEVSQELNYLYPFAWADFYRFLVGWNSQSAKISEFMKQQTQLCLLELAKC
ncbi:phosphotransferase [Thalassotalea sp. LPB0316]|uniref:phosphotransferase n=1 Tax=Thalassotalea sp. LPB0316 TaxID=2769490 RepID=UPI0018694424|nr:phosphotransferase [Thalassotalea sp. LPB0316]QOL26356.1 phosphotransferase [Thalassotalea sp. LPB0316]